MLHSIYDLTTFCRPTTGDVPAKLVGASTTVVGSKMYLFGGRLVSERRMVSDLYSFDLETFRWERVPAHPDDDVPRARYFHSADAWNNLLIIFGGMSNQPDSPNPDELCVLNDVRFFELSTRRWLPDTPLPPTVSDSLIPRARYAHLSSVTADRLFIIGGQDFYNTWLDDVCVYDLVGKAWVQRRDYPRHCGTYRSVAVSANMSVRLPQEEQKKAQKYAALGYPGTRFKSDGEPQESKEYTSSESLIHLPYSSSPTEGHPSDIYLYSNYNFTDVKRELEVFSPLPDTDFTMSDRSSAMTGSTFPPGLRFPTGAILGTHMIIAGTYLAHSYQSFSIWVLDLTTMNWSRIDPGKAVETGSWFRGCLWAEANKFLIFGNRHGNLVDDYNRRLLSWDHVAVVDLEAFGIYQPPTLKLDIPMQELGLAALEERVLTDFDIVCDDGRRIGCSRKLLEERWPWLKEQFKLFKERAKDAIENLPSSPMHVPLPELPTSATSGQKLDPRLTPRSFQLSEPYPITLAFLQYFYSLSLVTPLQHAPAVLSQLLVLGTNYKVTHLADLVRHAMHRALSNSTSVGVYEVATLCSCRSLQIRALKTVMSYTQKRPPRSRHDKENGSKPSDGGAGGGNSTNGSGGSGTERMSSRPRGTSDAKWRTGGGVDGNVSNHDYNNRAELRHQPSGSFEELEEEDELGSMHSFTPPQHRHGRAMSMMSTVSMSTDSELQAVARLMSPAVEATSHTRIPSNTSTMPDSDAHLRDPSRLIRGRDAAEELFAAHNVLPPDDMSGPEYPSPFADFNKQSKQKPLLSPPPQGGFHLPRRPNLGTIHTSLSDRSDTPSLLSINSTSSMGSMYTTSPSSLRTPSTVSSPSEYPDSTSPLGAVPEVHESSEWLGHDIDDDFHGGFRSDPRGWPKNPSNVGWKVPTASSSQRQRQRLNSDPHFPEQRPGTGNSEAYSYQDSRSPSSMRIWNETPSMMNNGAPSPDSEPTSPYSSKSPIGFSRVLSPTRGQLSPIKAVKSTGTLKSEFPIESKGAKADAKAEEKRRRKEEAKARTQALADQMKSRRQESKANSDKMSSHSSERGRKKEVGVMYGGLVM